ncbi:MAG: LOG family protein [Anaerolineales bacterium]|nr:LOG family protein [Anaerolineales bacterium]
MIEQPIVTVFGGAAPAEREPAYHEAEQLGSALAKAGFSVATGGYIGTMEAVSKGAAEAGGHVYGVTCEQIEAWRGTKPNPWVQEEIRCRTLRERLLQLVAIGDAWIALPGGIGTLSEISLCWSLLQTEEIAPRPLILIGDMWKSAFDCFRVSAARYVKPQDHAILKFAPNANGAVFELLENHFFKNRSL